MTFALLLKRLRTRFILTLIALVPTSALALAGMFTGASFESVLHSYGAYVFTVVDLVYIWHRKGRIQTFWKYAGVTGPTLEMRQEDAEQSKRPFYELLAQEILVRGIVFIPFGVAYYIFSGVELFIGMLALYLLMGIVYVYFNDVTPKLAQEKSVDSDRDEGLFIDSD